MAEEKVPTTVAKASGNASASGGAKGGIPSSLIEQAMADAAAALHKKGVWDDDEIREAKLAARKKVKADWNAEQERLAKEERERAEAE